MANGRALIALGPLLQDQFWDHLVVSVVASPRLPRLLHGWLIGTLPLQHMVDSLPNRLSIG